MSTTMEEEIKRWSARRKSALVMEILQDKMTVAEARLGRVAGTRELVFKDLPMHGKRVGIYIDTKRMRCQACGKTFSQALPVLAENRITIRNIFRRSP